MQTKPATFVEQVDVEAQLVALWERWRPLNSSLVPNYMYVRVYTRTSSDPVERCGVRRASHRTHVGFFLRRTVHLPH